MIGIKASFLRIASSLRSENSVRVYVAVLPPSLIFFFLNGLLCGKFVFLRTFHLISTTTTFECNVESSEMGMQEVLIMRMTRSDDANIYSCVDDVGLFCIYPRCDAGFRRPYI